MSEDNETYLQRSGISSSDIDDKSGNKYVVLGKIYRPEFSSAQGEEVREKMVNNNDSENDSEEEQFAREICQTGFLSQWFPTHQEYNRVDFALLVDIYSRITFTYRTRFNPIERAADGPSPISFQLMLRENPLNVLENVLTNPDCFNTDIGWGCMIRTGQSLLANTIQRIRLGRKFRVNRNYYDKDIIRLFKDTPEAPFSLHNFVQTGVKLSNMKPGQWFGPSATSRSIQNLVEEYPQSGIDKCIVSVSSGDIPKEVIDEAYACEMESKTLILLGVKLGINSVNELYWRDILNFFDKKFCVGIAGGRPASSLYFFGYEQEDLNDDKESQLLYFDPHTSQPTLNDEDYKTCHSVNYGKLRLKDMDPSMLVGIILENHNDWLELQEFATTSNIFNIISSKIDTLNLDESNMGIESLASEDDEMGEDDDLTEFSNDRGCIINSHSKSNLEENDIENDNNLTIIQSRKNTVTSIANDYIDVGSLAYCTPNSIDEAYESIQCKKQKIMIFDQDKSFEKMKNGDMEVEKVLVESDSIEPSTIIWR